MTNDDPAVDLRAHLLVLRRRKWTIVAVTLLATALALLQALLATPVYLASAEVAVEPPGGPANQALFGAALFGDQELQTQVRIITSEQVASRVIDSLTLPDDPATLLAKVQVVLIGDTRSLLIVVRDLDPSRAADLAQEFAESYLRFRREDGLERVLEATAALQSRATVLRDRIAEIDEQLGVTPGEQVLEDEREALVETLGALTTQLVLLDASEGFVRGGGQILRDAAVPTTPVEPRPLLSAIVGALIGIVAGVGLAFARDRIDDGLRAEEDAVSAMGGRPVLSAVPWHEEAARGELVTLVAPKAPASEAFRTLRTNLRFISGPRPFRTVLFTSAVEAEGKTTTAANYAVAAARAGYVVLLMDADLRVPRIHELFGLENGLGTSHLLTAQAEVESVLHAGGVPGLYVVTAGLPPPNPSELLGSQTMFDLLDDLTETFDLVVLDAPPVLPVADALELATNVDACVLSLHVDHTRKRLVTATTERLDRLGARIAGSVLTAVHPRRTGYGYYYGSYGGDDSPRGRKGRRTRRRGDELAPATSSRDQR